MRKEIFQATLGGPNCCLRWSHPLADFIVELQIHVTVLWLAGNGLLRDCYPCDLTHFPAGFMPNVLPLPGQFPMTELAWGCFYTNRVLGWLQVSDISRSTIALLLLLELTGVGDAGVKMRKLESLKTAIIRFRSVVILIVRLGWIHCRGSEYLGFFDQAPASPTPLG
ncbi:uncharacterized protein N7515_010274 [Penicillium bovifimosum]|uniref:Uncharacterized protein n=1 Tax=Penicillium bovifimosum TaxID=126998 RepID=A0A9W9GIH4_9EURO|nr:uncharacterized protein N7515_010274 [Penicillium bovifimosum]KAJ5120886.1 hypothetical protein N7515_010274 [Penicillium bovifimosum]